MRIVNIKDAETNLSALVDAVGRGKEIVIARAGRPAARLVPFQRMQRERKPGALKGKMRVADGFDAPLPEALVVTFLGS